ncbi:restriction endonuclease subunit S [Fictibacillus phosphorivorans]|uniref:restriction endonuclease subunit S n=1 Tax=Fictibacillus phosphorivorans TaxID=1221500 RepID=UPI001293F0FD|nr:restriction endonuclease subunit S [Fictibacillus phosphorivorans]MQR93695.1 restriction endonuclease subunit S [Fictibacillus phosphorivorans]
MSELKQYPSYFDTNIKWLGKIPNEWEINKIKKSVKSAKNGIWGEEFQGNENDIGCVRITDFNRRNYEVKDVDFTIRNIPKGKQAPYILKQGDLLIEKSGGGEKQPVGFVARYGYDRPAIYANFMARIDLNEEFMLSNYAKYLHSTLYAHRINVRSIKQTTGIQNLDTVNYFQELVPYPSLNEQLQISKFLDDCTDEIDSLVADKEKLIVLLNEKLQATITEAVTKGLSLDVEMKGSSVESIGEIPEHWEIKRLNYLGSLQNGISKSSEEFGFGHPFVSYGDVYKNMVLPGTVIGLVNSSTFDRTTYSVKAGDVFFTRTSETIEEIGIASTCLKTIEEATFAGFLIRFRPNSKKLTTNFAKYYFRSDIGRKYFVKEMNLVTRASLSQGLLKKFPVVLPPIEEQNQIVQYLDFNTSKIKESIKLLQEQIIKLKDYRQSIIYEAVTGKIDVRDYNKVLS